MAHPDLSAYFKGFSKLTRAQRFARLQQMGALNAADISWLQQEQTPPNDLAEELVENVIGYFSMPLGVATNFCIDGVDRVIPMAVEETSIIAAASKTARWVREHGSIHTETIGTLNTGQIQWAHVKDFPAFRERLEPEFPQLINDLNSGVAASLQARGGGVSTMHLREVPRTDGSDSMAVLHVLVDTVDAMGANILNQLCETLKAPLEMLSGAKVNLCILSNLCDGHLTRATVTINNPDADDAHGIVEASQFAELDPYRAATHNKGVLNGIDPILIATGNDWRAVEAGIHAYAARHGRYQAITQWRLHNNKLVGVFEAPLVVGTVGGMTKLHPTAQMCLRMLQVQHADELARIAAAVGLVQNLGALQALSTVGIVAGHMKLHVNNLILNTDATQAEVPLLRRRLQQLLATSKRISLSQAQAALQQLRRAQHGAHEVDVVAL